VSVQDHESEVIVLLDAMRERACAGEQRRPLDNPRAPARPSRSAKLSILLAPIRRST